MINYCLVSPLIDHYSLFTTSSNVGWTTGNEDDNDDDDDSNNNDVAGVEATASGNGRVKTDSEVNGQRQKEKGTETEGQIDGRMM
jgi:hypothetical protein